MAPSSRVTSGRRCPPDRRDAAASCGSATSVGGGSGWCTGGEADLGVLVRRVVVGDREVARAARAACPRAPPARPSVRGKRPSRADASAGSASTSTRRPRRTDLGHAAELADRAGDLDEVALVDRRGERRREDEDAVGRLVGRPDRVATGAVGLQVEAVEAAGLVDRGDDTLRGDRLARQRAGRRCPGSRRSSASTGWAGRLPSYRPRGRRAGRRGGEVRSSELSSVSAPLASSGRGGGRRGRS